MLSFNFPLALIPSAAPDVFAASWFLPSHCCFVNTFIHSALTPTRIFLDYEKSTTQTYFSTYMISDLHSAAAQSMQWPAHICPFII